MPEPVQLGVEGQQEQAAPPSQPLRVLMVTDFFFPNCGGVENHVYQLAQCLLAHEHKVVVMTHAYGDRTGVRYLTNGLKVHAHQAFSVLGNEALLHARTMGHRVVFTDHSLFGFADPPSILHNKLLKWILCDVHHAVCVSRTSKENTVLRACLPPARVSVIPNAVDMPKFRPFPRPASDPDRPCVVILNRLVYRKGIDLQLLVIPQLCKRYSTLRFVIGGDGPKRSALQAMIETHNLQDRVTLAGEVPHEAVRDFLVQGEIFLNTSLTEAFCMAIVEAACAGLLVVSTNVGGVPEVLPHDICLLADPEPQALLRAMDAALQRYKRVDPQQQHDRVSQMYDWNRIATRTEAVYQRVLAGASQNEWPGRLRRMRACGPFFGLLAICFAVLDALWLRIIEWLDPAHDIDIAPTLLGRGAAAA